MRRYSIKIYLVVLLLLCANIVFAVKNPICAKCGKKIVGEAIEAEGKFYHPHHFTCDYCGKIIQSNYSSQDGKIYHPECFQQLFGKKCAICGKPIEGKYIIKDGKNYHSYCYDDKVAPHCLYSGEPIKGQYIENYWGEIIDAKYNKYVETCDVSGKFALPGKATRLSDGRIIRNEYINKGINDKRSAEKALRRTLDLMRVEGIVIPEDISRKIKVNLVDRTTLSGMSDRVGTGDQYGLCEYKYESLGKKIIRKDFTIHILTHLPEELFIGVMSHELFHVWQHLNEADKGNLPWQEGSANVVMYEVLENLGNDLARYHMDSLNKNPDKIYGNGFRTAMKIYKNRDMRGFLDEVRKKCGK